LQACLDDGEDEDRGALVGELADARAARSTIEEQIFYPSVMVERTEALLREAVEEHLSIKRLLVDLMGTGIEDKSFMAKVKVLREQVEHHVEEEEGELFKKVTKTCSDEDLETFGEKMEAAVIRSRGRLS
jgi:hypothetical protein